MKIAMAGIGRMKIDQNSDFGPEVVIWQLKTNLEKLGVQVDIINTTNKKKFHKEVQRINPDILHVHHFDLIDLLVQSDVPIKIATTHNPYMDRVFNQQALVKKLQKTLNSGIGFNLKFPFIEKYVRKILRLNAKSNQLKVLPQARAVAKFAHYQDQLNLFCLSDRMKRLFEQHQIDSSKLFVTPNGANHELFRYNLNCKFPEKSIYVANIAHRKRQYLFQSIESIDFVGQNFANYKNNFNIKIDNYLGPWTRPQIHDRLTNYANLILLSDGEAHPLTCCEALMCGLGLVVSEVASGNLDKTKPYIDVIPEDKINDIAYIGQVIDKNRRESVKRRDEIRAYGLDSFSWKNRAQNYYKIASTLTNIKN